MPFDISKLLISLLLVCTFMTIDLWTKREAWKLDSSSRASLISGDKITITVPVRNYGGPGIFSHEPPDQSFHYWHIFVAFVSLACFWCLVLSNERIWHSAIGAIPVGGMWGNVYEMLIYGSVTDFIRLNGFGVLNSLTFNVADVFIFAGLPIYYLTEEIQPYDKFISLLLHVSIFSLFVSILPSEPSVYIAIGCLYYLLIWPDPEEGRV